MNSYHPYGDISSPHPPSPDNNNYASSMSIGNAGGHHHNGHAQHMSSIGGQQQGFHQINNNNAMMNKCAGCGSKIAERYLLSAIDKFWHHTCLKCTCCGATLADLGTVCYTKGNMILCKADYSRMFAPPPCSACNQTISPNEFVMRTSSQSSNQQSPNQPNPIQHHVFHLKCFTCSNCTSQLRQGDRYYMLNGKLVCEQDWHKLVKAPVANNSTPPVRKGKVGRPRRSRDLEVAPRLGRPPKIRKDDIERPNHMNLPLSSLNNHASNTFNRNLNDSNLLLNRSATMLSPPNLATQPAASMPHQPLTNDLYSTLYGRELELMRKIYKAENRDQLDGSPLMQSPHQPDALLIKNAGYPMSYPTASFGVPNSQYHHALSPSRTPPKVHHPDQILSPDRMIKQEDKNLYNSPPSNYPGYGNAAMSPTSLLGNMTNSIGRKYEDVLGMSANHKHLYDDRKMPMNAGFNKDHHDGYGDPIYDTMNPSSGVHNYLHMQQEHDKHNQRPNTTKHNSPLIGNETANHFYNIGDYESDKRQHHSHQLFQQNQFSINNAVKDNSGVNMEKSPNTSKLSSACSHSDSNNNHNNDAKSVRMSNKFGTVTNANETFDRSKMCTKIKIEATSKINANKVNSSATNLLPHSKCATESSNDFMLHIRVKEQKQQIQNANGRLAQMDFDEASNSCESPEDAANYNDDEGDEFMNL